MQIRVITIYPIKTVPSEEHSLFQSQGLGFHNSRVVDLEGTTPKGKWHLNPELCGQSRELPKASFSDCSGTV